MGASIYILPHRISPGTCVAADTVPFRVRLFADVPARSLSDVSSLIAGK
jgi:hypothetical protein